MPSYSLNTAGYPVYTNGRKIVRASDGTLWAVYQASDGSYTQIYASYSTDDGQTWTEEQVTSGATSKYFPGIAIDSNGDVHVVYQDGTSEIKYIKRSGSWGTPETVVALSGAGYEAVPSIDIDSSGVLHVAYVDYDAGEIKAYYIKKSGGSWGSPEEIAILDSGSYLYGSGVSIGVDTSGNVHTVYAAKNRGTYTYAFQICYRKRTTSWQTEELITDRDGTQERPVIAIDQSGDIHVGWIGEYIDNGVTNWGWRQNVGYCKRTSGWGSIEVLADVNNTQDFITVSIDKSSNIHAVWSGKGWGTYSTYNNIQYRKNTGTWQARVAITNSANDNNNPNLVHSFYPLSNSPYIGYAFLRSVGANLYYEYSSDLVWGSSLPDEDFMLSETKLLDYFAPYRVYSTTMLESPLYAEKTFKLLLNQREIWRLTDETGTVKKFTEHPLPLPVPNAVIPMMEIMNYDKVFISSRRLSKYPLSLENHFKQYNLNDKDAASDLALSDYEDWLESIYEKNGKLYLNGIEITDEDWTNAVVVDTLQVPGVWDPQTETFEKLISIAPYTTGELSRAFVCSSVTLNLQPVFSTVNLDHPCVYSTVDLLENGVTITPASDFIRSAVSLSGLYTEKTHQLLGFDKKDSFTLKIIPQENSDRLIGYIRMPSDTVAPGGISYYIDFIILMDSSGHILSQRPFYSLHNDTLLPVGSKVVSEFYMLDDTTMAALLTIYTSPNYYDIAIGIYNTSFKLTEIRKNSPLNVTDVSNAGFTKNRCYFHDEDNNILREADLNFNLTKIYTYPAGYYSGIGGNRYREIILPLFIKSEVSFETEITTVDFVKSLVPLTLPKQSFLCSNPILSLTAQDFIRASTELKEKSDESPYQIYSSANLAVLPADHYLLKSPVSLCAPLTELECLGYRQYDFNAGSNPKASTLITDDWLLNYAFQIYPTSIWQSSSYTISKLSKVYYNDGYAVLILKLTPTGSFSYKQELCIRKYDLSNNQVGSDISIAKSNDSFSRGIFDASLLFMKNKFYVVFKDYHNNPVYYAIESTDFTAIWKNIITFHENGILCYDFDGNFVTGLKFDETSLNIDVRGVFLVWGSGKVVQDGTRLLIVVNRFEAYPQKIVMLNEFLLLSSSEIIPDPNEFGGGFEIRAANGSTIILSTPDYSSNYHMIDYSGNHILHLYPPEQGAAVGFYIHPYYPPGQGPQHPAISVNKNNNYVFSGRTVIGGTNYESKIVIHDGRTGQRLKVIIFTNSSDDELGEYHFHRIHRFVQSEVNLYADNIPKEVNLLDWYNVDVGGIII